jgi:hypothetical protein
VGVPEIVPIFISYFQRSHVPLYDKMALSQEAWRGPPAHVT